MITTLVVFGVAILLIGLMFGAVLGGIAIEAGARSTREQLEEEVIRLRNELGRVQSARRLDRMREEARKEAEWAFRHGVATVPESAPEVVVAVGAEPVGMAS